jgi:hypothetical protein
MVQMSGISFGMSLTSRRPKPLRGRSKSHAGNEPIMNNAVTKLRQTSKSGLA